MLNVEIIVSGIVQGVGFRAYTKECAEKLNINGYVRNLVNSNVYIIAIGNRENINKFISQIKIGSRRSTVKNIEINFIKEKLSFTSFDIKFY